MSDDDLAVSRDASTLHQHVVKRLRQAITEGRFRPEDRLIERTLCELLGVSRTLVREALRQLEAEEFVITSPYKGPVVCTSSTQW